LTATIQKIRKSDYCDEKDCDLERENQGAQKKGLHPIKKKSKTASEKGRSSWRKRNGKKNSRVWRGGASGGKITGPAPGGGRDYFQERNAVGGN